MSAALLRLNMDLTRVAVVEAPPTPTPPPAPALGTTRVRETDGAVMVWVTAGEFLMGSADSDSQAVSDEKPQHTVSLAGYWIDRTEVTNAQYRKFMDAGGYNRQEYWTETGWAWKQQNNVTQPKCGDYSGLDQSTRPVVCVSWYEAVAYARWAGARLPTEAEWEKAARGTDGRIFPWGNEALDCNRSNYCGCGSRPEPVGSYANGVSPYGAYDLAGNVCEWVSTEFRSYPYSSRDGRENLNGINGRVKRGGGWAGFPWDARSVYRVWGTPDGRDGNCGFRVAFSGQ